MARFFLISFFFSFISFFYYSSSGEFPPPRPGSISTWPRARPSNRERSMKMKSKLVVLLTLVDFPSFRIVFDRRRAWWSISWSIIDLFSFSWRRFSVDDAPNVSRAELWSGWATVVPARRWEIPATPPGISALSASAPGCSSSPPLPGTRSRCDRASRTTPRSVLLPPDDGDLSSTHRMDRSNFKIYTIRKFNRKVITFHFVSIDF